MSPKTRGWLRVPLAVWHSAAWPAAFWSWHKHAQQWSGTWPWSCSGFDKEWKLCCLGARREAESIRDRTHLPPSTGATDTPSYGRLKMWALSGCYWLFFRCVSCTFLGYLITLCKLYILNGWINKVESELKIAFFKCTFQTAVELFFFLLVY